MTLDTGELVLITSAGGPSFGDTRGFIIGSADPTAQAEVAAGIPASAIMPGTERTRAIAARMLDVGHRPSQMAAVNAQLLAEHANA